LDGWMDGWMDVWPARFWDPGLCYILVNLLCFLNTI
jgi:hypothetical protein